MAGRIAYYGGIVTDGLVLHLDAAKRDSYPGSGTVWRDLSGNGNNGTLVNGVGYDRDSGNGSMVFDGVDDFITIGALPQIGPNSFTISTYLSVNESPVTSDDGIFNPDDYTALSQGVYLWVNQSMNFHYIITTENGIELNNRNNLNFQLNTYYYITITYQKNVIEGAKLYVDNSLFETTNTVGFGDINNTLNYLISRRGTALNAYYLKSNILSTKVYNRALSDAEVLQNYNALKSRFGL